MLRFGSLLFSAFIPLVALQALDFEDLPPDFEKSFDIQPFNPKFSGRIAFAAKMYGLDRIMVLDLDARKIRRAIVGPGNSTYPNFSPDGSKLAFTSERDGKRSIYVSDWDGGNPQRLTNSKDQEDNPAWSPDGKFITFNSESSTGDNATSNIFTVELASKKITQVTKFSGKNTLPRFTADGKSISYNTNRFWPGWDICLWNLVGKFEKCPLGGNVSYCRGAWSNSGKILALSQGSGEQIDISILNADEKVPEQLSEQSGKDYDAAWSPDDTHLLYVSESPETKAFNLFVAEVESKKSQPLILSANSIRFPTWSKVKTLELEARRIVKAEATTAVATNTPEPTITAEPSPTSEPLATPTAEATP